MTGNEAAAFEDIYAGCGAIARNLGPALDALAQLLDVGATPAELVAVLDEIRTNVERAYGVAAAIRERYAR